jgi:hypothetical protein
MVSRTILRPCRHSHSGTLSLTELCEGIEGVVRSSSARSPNDHETLSLAAEATAAVLSWHLSC